MEGASALLVAPRTLEVVPLGVDVSQNFGKIFDLSGGLDSLRVGVVVALEAGITGATGQKPVRISEGEEDE